ncbi:MAG: HEAT repeat domain-containing protein [Planctomycetota bacterium]|nr:HEAT repeat domain-containing protein [Planctomycetota bacterium]
MTDTIRAILAILEQDRPPELKIAAAQILGELAPKDAAVVKGLEQRLSVGEDFISRHVLAALGAIGSAAATRVLVLQLDGKHPDLAAHLLAELGDAAVDALAAAFEGASHEARLRILGILARANSPKVAEVAEQALLLPEFSKRAADVLVHVAEGFDARRMKPLKTRLTKALGAEDMSPQVASSLLARLDAAGSRATLIKFAGAEQPAMVRQAALHALKGVKLTPTQAASLLDLVHEDDQVHVVEPVLSLLDHHDTWPDASVPELRKLIGHRNPRIRLFAVRALRNVPRAEHVKPLIQLLHGDDADLGAAASGALGANPDALGVLLRSLQQEKDPERARRTSEPLSRLARSLPAKDLRTLIERGARLLLSQDPVGEVVLGLVIRAQPEKGANEVVDRAVRFRKQRKFAEAVSLLAFLAAAGVIPAEGRYHLAVSRLLFDVAEQAEGRARGVCDATMGYFALLIREGFPLLQRLKKETMLAPEDLFALGEHFAEAGGEERRFGAALLLHLAEKHPRRKAGEEARSVLRAEGL